MKGPVGSGSVRVDNVMINKETCDLKLCQDLLVSNFKNTWVTNLTFKPKLRLYRQIKHDINPERYVKLNLTSSQRSFMAQLRFGILPIQVETGRFSRLKLEDRICQQCQAMNIEDELHFLFHCTLYHLERQEFYREVSLNCQNFTNMNDINKLIYCTSTETRKLAKYIMLLFEKRNSRIHV